MPRKRDPKRNEAKKIYNSNPETPLVEIAKQLNLPEATIRAWKSKDNWSGANTEKKTNGTLRTIRNAPNDTERSEHRKKNQTTDYKGVGVNNNLIPLNQRTINEQRAIQSAGGKASGKARIHRRTLQDILELKAPSEITEKLIEAQMLENGIEIDLETARQYRLAMLAVIDGDLQAIKYVDSRIGLDPHLEFQREKLNKEVAVDYERIGAIGVMRNEARTVEVEERNISDFEND